MRGRGLSCRGPHSLAHGAVDSLCRCCSYCLSQGVLLKLYKASSEKKKTQQFLLEFVQDLVTDSPHADVRFLKTNRALSLPPYYL